MAIPPGTLRVTFQTALGGSEIALYGFHCQVLDVEAVSQSLLVQVAEKARDAWLDSMSAEKGAYSTGVVWQAVRCDLLDPQPGPSHLKVVDSGFANFAQSGDGSYAGTGATSLPWETSMVVSLAAYPAGSFAVNKGRRRGRFYLPPMVPAVVSGPTGEFTPQTLTNSVAAFGDFLEQMTGEISDTIPDQLRVVVLSQVDDAVRPVEHLWIDSKVDSQRRRENRQPARQREIYSLTD
jgi:hypothetical protein